MVVLFGLCLKVTLSVALKDGAELVAALGLDARALKCGDVVAEVDLRFAVDAAVFKAAVVDALLVAGAFKGVVGLELPLGADVEQGLLAVEGEALWHAASFGVLGAGACEVVLCRSL